MPITYYGNKNKIYTKCHRLSFVTLFINGYIMTDICVCQTLLHGWEMFQDLSLVR